MYNVSADFHTLAIQDSAQTRARIYFIGDAVDCTDDNDVQTNGTLLVWASDDTDSNARITKTGIRFNEIFNKDQNVSIGGAVSYQISMTLNNADGMLNDFSFGRCKVYLDVYDAANSVWLPCPMGVFNIATPARRMTQLISATGYDQMQDLDVIADSWWNGLDWSGGLTLLQIVQSMAATLGVSLSANTPSAIVNSSLSFTEPPFTSTEATYREILGVIAEATGTIARFDRDGALDLRWFDAAQIDGNIVQIDTDTVGNQCLSIDLAEYSVAPVDALDVKSSELDVGVSVGAGSNAYQIINNPIMGGADEAEITTKATPVYNKISALTAFNPISTKAIYDWSIEAGDIIEIVRDGNAYMLPIFQQTILWRGTLATATVISTGTKTRPVETIEKRSLFRTQAQFHELEITIDTLRSRIESIDGNYTLIEQTVNSISQTVANQSTTIENILDPTGEIWTAITNNASNLSEIEDNLNDEIATRQSYIRFIPAEPAIVLGVDTGNEIKLKLVNNVIYFFNGSDDSTDLSLAYAYFNSQEAGADRFVAKESVTMGNWIWKQLANGDLVLDHVE